MDDPLPARAYIVAVVEHLKKPFNSIVSLVHSMVMSVRIVHEDMEGTVLGSGELVIPPVVVESQDAVTIGKTIVNNVENRMTDMPIRDFIRGLAGLGVVLVVVLMSADSASANLSCMMVLKAIHMIALPVFVYWHFEPCGVHQLMRATVRLSALTHQKAVMKSQSKLLKSKHNRKAFEARALHVFRSNFELNGTRLTVLERAERERQVKCLKEVLGTRSTAQKHLGEIRADESERLGVQEAAFSNFLDFCNNSIPGSGGKWSRIDESMTPAEAEAEAAELFRLCLFHSSVPAYNESRILRYMECCTFWARFHALAPFSKQIWDSVVFAESKKPGAVADQLRAENGVRLARAKKFAADARSRSLSLLFFMSMQHTEELVHLFFYMNTDASDAFQPEGREPDIEVCKATKRRMTKHKLGLGSIVDAVERHCGELWSAVVAGQAASERVHTVKAFWPSSLPHADLDRLLRMSAATCLGEIVHRFLLKHRQPPHSTFPRQAQPEPSPDACKAVIALAKRRPCCVRHMKNIIAHANAEAPGRAPERGYARSMRTLDRQIPGASIPAEKMHAEQRFHSMESSDRKPSGFARQASAHVGVHSSKIWRSRGGPALDVIRAKDKKQFQVATSRPTYRRRTGGVKASFAYVQQRLTAQVTLACL